MENLSFQYPSWYLIFCFLLGAIFSLVLYYRDTTFREQSNSLNLALGIIRFLTISLLSFLLLSPLLRSLIKETKKPIVVVAQDQSESVLSNWDSLDRQAYKTALENLNTTLAEDYELKTYSFGNEVKEGITFEYNDKTSNISEVLKTVTDLYSNQNLGAVILATDGIYNEGSNPVYVNSKITAPVYTIALGDTTAKKDLILKRVFHNKITYLGDRFSVLVDISAINAAGNRSSLSVYQIENGQPRKLQEEIFTIDNNDFFTTKEIFLEANKSGVQRFRVTLSAIEGEVTVVNNRKDIFIDVLDARQKILVLAHSPHPDLTALRQVLSKNKNYEVEVSYIDQFNDGLAAYDFVILHQLPAKGNVANRIFIELNQKKIPVLFIVGSQSDLSTLNQAQELVSIKGDGRNTNDVQARVAGEFNLFNLEEEVRSNLPQFAPLTAPFGEFTANADAQVLLYQRIGKIDTRYPLLVIGESNQIKTGVLCGEGIWKWRLFNFLQFQNHDIFDEVIAKTVQYLSLKEDKRRFRVNLNQNIFNENEPIFFDAELYNNSYELINDVDVSLVIKNKAGKEFPFTFNKTNQSYTLNAGIFPVGSYTYQGSCFVNGEQLNYNGQFSIQPIQLELYETTADHNLLRLLSERFGGTTVSSTEVASLIDQLKQKETVKPVIYQTTKTRSVINLKWICLLLVGLLTVEWFFRRYFGAY